MTDVAGCRAIIRRAGLKLLGDFVLPEAAWWDRLLRSARSAHAAARAKNIAATRSPKRCLDEAISEVAVYRNYSAYFGYQFFVMSRSAAWGYGIAIWKSLLRWRPLMMSRRPDPPSTSARRACSSRPRRTRTTSEITSDQRSESTPSDVYALQQVGYDADEPRPEPHADDVQHEQHDRRGHRAHAQADEPLRQRKHRREPDTNRACSESIITQNASQGSLVR